MIVNTELSRSIGHISKDLWETPKHIFDPLNDEFGFTLDPACTKETAKVKKFYTSAEDGLKMPWYDDIVFCNPPYSRDNIDKWVKKCYIEEGRGACVVALLPVSTSARWFHDYIVGKASIRFYERRIRFVDAPFTAPFSSMLAIWNGDVPLNVTSIKQYKD